jgi:hypothetical protein
MMTGMRNILFFLEGVLEVSIGTISFGWNTTTMVDQSFFLFEYVISPRNGREIRKSLPNTTCLIFFTPYLVAFRLSLKLIVDTC